MSRISVDEARRGVVVRVVGRVRPRRRREVAQVEAHQLERGGVVGRDVVDQPARDRDAGSAELLLGDLLPQRLEHHRRAGGEDRRVRAHHREVGHRRDQRAVAGRRAEHRGDQRHVARAARLREQVGRRAAVGLAVGAEAGAVEHHHQRHAVAQRELGDAVALRVGGVADRARLHGEVLGGDHHRTAARRGPTRARWRRPGPRRHRRACRARGTNRGRRSASMRARASSLPCPWCLASRSVAAHRAAGGAALLEVGEGGVPVVAQLRHLASIRSHPRELGDELELVGPVGPDDDTGHARRHDAARLPLLPDARGRADQRALEQRLVGHRRDRLLAPAGEEQLLDARRVVGEAALGHRLDVVVVRLAAHAADVRGAVRADAVEPALARRR